MAGRDLPGPQQCLPDRGRAGSRARRVFPQGCGRFLVSGTDRPSHDLPVQRAGRVLASCGQRGNGHCVELSGALPGSRPPGGLCRFRSGQGPRDNRQGYFYRGAAMTESTLERMITIFDVEPLDPALTRFAGDNDGAGRQVVDGSQILAQSLVAASKALPGRTVRCAHALVGSAANPASQLQLTVTPVRAGRSVASATVAVSQGDRTCATSTVLLDHPQPDAIRPDRSAGHP